MPDDYELVERNLRHSLSFYARAQAGDIHESPGVLTISCGRDYPLFNSALLTTPVPGPGGDLGLRITVAQDYFRHLRHGWSYWICENMLDKDSRRVLHQVFQARRMRKVVDSPGMTLRGVAPERRLLPKLDIRPISDAPTRLSFCHITAAVFDVPFVVGKEVYDSDRAWDNSFFGFIGYHEGRAICSATVALRDGVAGLYSVATMPEIQRRGYGQAIVRHAIAAGRAAGANVTILQATRSGLPLYRSLGFDIAGHFVVYRSN